MTVARRISPSFADVVAQLEFDGDTVITADRLADVTRQAGYAGPVRTLAYELQRGGWLGTLRTRHAWEFLPGSRGGPYGSGDRFIEVRAQRAVNPEWPGVLAMESAASVLGLAQRIPQKEVVALPKEVPLPAALKGTWRKVQIDLPERALTTIAGLPAWSREGLLVGIAVRPSAYQDFAGLGQWLGAVPYGVDVSTLVRALDGVTAAARQRAAYLLWASGNVDAATAVIEAYPPSETAWIGPRQPGGFYESVSKVSDTELFPFLSVGESA